MKVNFNIIPEKDKIIIFNDFIYAKLKDFFPSKNIFIRFFYSERREFSYLVIMKLNKISIDSVINYLNNNLTKEKFSETFLEIRNADFSFNVEFLDNIENFYYIKIKFKVL